MGPRRRAQAGIGAGLIGLVALGIGLAPTAGAAPRGLPSIVLRAPEPGSYPRDTGGGIWGDGRQLMPSLAPRPASCGDIVSVLVAIDVPADAEPADLRVVLSLLPEMTGQPGAGLVPVEGGVALTLADSGAHGDGGSAVSDVVVVPAADPTAHGEIGRAHV